MFLVISIGVAAVVQTGLAEQDALATFSGLRLETAIGVPRNWYWL